MLSYTVQLNHSSELFSIGIFFDVIFIIIIRVRFCLVVRCCSAICWVLVCNGCWILRWRFVARSRGETINLLDTIRVHTIRCGSFLFYFFFLGWVLVSFAFWMQHNVVRLFERSLILLFIECVVYCYSLFAFLFVLKYIDFTLIKSRRKRNNCEKGRCREWEQMNGANKSLPIENVIEYIVCP